MTRKRAGRRRLLVAGSLIAALGAGHWVYWYAPRSRAAVPAESRLTANAPSAEARLWVPYPHQNLATLERALGGDVDRVVRAVAVLAGVEGAVWPSMPLGRFPPADELLLAWSPGRLWVGAELYPLAALLGRGAGRLVGNPWLGGGEVVVAGQPASVSWSGTTWSLSSGRVAAGGGSLGGDAPALAVVEMAAPRAPLPAGAYGLVGEETGFTWRLGAGRQPGPSFADAAVPELALAAFWRTEQNEPRVSLLFDRGGGGLGELPAAAAWSRDGQAERLLPGGRLLSAVGDLPGEELSGGELVATGSWALERARSLGPLIGELVAVDGPRLEVWAAVEPTARLADLLVSSLEALPLGGSRDVERWRAVADLLAVGSRFSTAEAWVAPGGDGAEIAFGD